MAPAHSARGNAGDDMTLVQRLVLLVVLALAPVLGGVAYSLAQLRELRTREEAAEAQRLVTLVEAQHRRLNEAVSLLLTSVAVEAPRVLDRPEDCAALLRRLAAPGFQWLDLMVLDAAGIVRCSTVAGTLGADRAGHPEAAQAAARDGLVLSPLALQAFQQEATQQAAIRWTGADNAHGVVLATIRPASFLTPLIRDVLPEDAAIIVADWAGHVLYAVPDLPTGPARNLPAALATTARRDQSVSAHATWLDGSDRIVASRTISAPAAPGISVLAGIVNATALDDVSQVAHGIYWVLGLTLLIGPAVAWWGGIHYIRRPLGILTEAALRWRDGDQTARVRLPGRSEIAALGRVFDQMADATEQGERQLREAADLLNALIESSADAIFVKDRDGRYVLANSTFADLTGHSREALVGLRDVDVMGQDLGETVRNIHATILQSGAAQVVDLTLVAKRGRAAGPRILQTMYAPIRAADGTVAAIAGIGRDVTDAREAAASLLAAKERAEAADESKTRFLAAASHDLRQPVQAALLFSSLIGEHAPENLRKPAEQLRLVLDDLRAMLDSLFDVSRYDTQVMRADIAGFPLQPLLDQTMAAVAAAAQAKGITLLTPSTPYWVRSDHTLLGRMLGNIVGNAVRYTTAGSVSIRVAPREGMLRIDVIDTGPGIAAEDLSRIWQEFEQLHNPGRDRRQGLGLGLAIVRRLSRILGHPVSVASMPGQGTVFSIDVPRAEPVITETIGQPATRAPRPAGRELVAVVVEDDPPLLAVLAMILEDHGWTVIAAPDTDAALHMLDGDPRQPHVILTDYRLRDAKLGSAAIAAIRAKLGRLVPAIILTGDTGTGEASADGPLRDAARLGDVIVLRKPVAAGELVAALNRAVTATAG